jgi:hypothetical protein
MFKEIQKTKNHKKQEITTKNQKYMILNAYTIKDQKAGTYSNPYYAVNDATAIRTFKQACSDKNTTLNQYPEDFSLFKVGIWDDQSAEIKSLDPEFIINAIQEKPEQPKANADEAFLEYVEN